VLVITKHVLFGSWLPSALDKELQFSFRQGKHILELAYQFCILVLIKMSFKLVNKAGSESRFFLCRQACAFRVLLFRTEIFSSAIWTPTRKVIYEKILLLCAVKSLGQKGKASR